MKLSPTQLQGLRSLPNSGYEKFKVEFLFHSNKMEGSTFSKDQIYKVIKEKEVEGQHKLDDVYETKNSIDLFEFVVDTITEPLSESLIKEYHSLLMKNSNDIIQSHLAGRYRPIPAEISSVDLELSDPATINYDMEKLLDNYNNNEVHSIYSIATFHKDFEHIHPFHDGNGRVGRFIMMKQCVDNNIDLIAIDSKFEKEYKNSLYIAQKDNNIEPLVEVFKACQNRLNEKVPYIENAKTLIDDIYKNNNEDSLDNMFKKISNKYINKNNTLTEPFIYMEGNTKLIPLSVFTKNNSRGHYEEKEGNVRLYDTNKNEILRNRIYLGKNHSIVNQLKNTAISQNKLLELNEQLNLLKTNKNSINKDFEI